MHCAGSTINATCILCCVQVLSRSTPRGYWTPMYTYCVQWERPQRLHQQFRCDLGHCDAFNGAMVCLQCPGAPQTVHSAAGAACITLLHVPIPVRAPVHIGHTMPVPVLLVYMYMYMYRAVHVGGHLPSHHWIKGKYLTVVLPGNRSFSYRKDLQEGI